MAPLVCGETVSVLRAAHEQGRLCVDGAMGCYGVVAPVQPNLSEHMGCTNGDVLAVNLNASKMSFFAFINEWRVEQRDGAAVKHLNVKTTVVP